jgi:hypothetical protein
MPGSSACSITAPAPAQTVAAQLPGPHCSQAPSRSHARFSPRGAASVRSWSMGSSCGPSMRLTARAAGMTAYATALADLRQRRRRAAQIKQALAAGPGGAIVRQALLRVCIFGGEVTARQDAAYKSPLGSSAMRNARQQEALNL